MDGLIQYMHTNINFINLYIKQLQLTLIVSNYMSLQMPYIL